MDLMRTLRATTRRGERTVRRDALGRGRWALCSLRRFPGTYVVGYSVFGILMAQWLFASSRKGPNDKTMAEFEMLYSWAGLVAKLALVFSELCVFNGSDDGADAVLGITIVLVFLIIVSGWLLIPPSSSQSLVSPLEGHL